MAIPTPLWAGRAGPSSDDRIWNFLSFATRIVELEASFTAEEKERARNEERGFLWEWISFGGSKSAPGAFWSNADRSISAGAFPWRSEF